MAIRQLTEEQIRTWTREEKDRWWLENVYRGHMPQLTWRSAITGMILGGVLSITNLYIGAKSGWSLGVGMTSVILAFAIFRIFSRLGLARDLTILENNCSQSVATAAGYVTMPLTAMFPAYMLITHQEISLIQITVWIITVCILGVLFAFPLKRRFINDEQQPFPEGRAAGIVLDSLYGSQSSSDPSDTSLDSQKAASEGLFKARLLMYAALFSSIWTVFSHHDLFAKLDSVMKFHIPKWLRLPGTFDAWLYKFVDKPFSLGGVDLRELTITCGNDISMFGLGGLVGIRTGSSLLIGAIVNYCILAPWMISIGDIPCKVTNGVPQIGVYGFDEILKWSLWGGVAMMTTASLWSFLADPKALLSAVRIGGKKKSEAPTDCLKHIELPYRVFWIGIPIVSALVVWETWAFFQVPILLGVIAIPLIFIFTIIAVHATALTAITPVGSLGKLTQLTFAVLHPGSTTSNLASAGITASVASNASNLLMDIKPGYMLGAKPRQQAIGHVLGIIAGTCVSVPVWSLLFLQDGVDNVINKTFPMPSAVAWKAVAEMLSKGLSVLPISACWAALVGGILGIVFEVIRKRTHGRFPLSPVGLGLACLLDFSNCFVIFLGSFFFWFLHQRAIRSPEKRRISRIFAENQETISGGLIAGAALMAVVIQLILVFGFPSLK